MIAGTAACKRNALTFSAGFIAAVFVAAGALAQPVEHAQTGLAVTPPPAYAAQLDTKSNFTARIVVTRKDDPSTLCYIDFTALTDAAIAKSTQNQLNEMMRKVDQKAAMQGNFEAETLERMEYAGVVGAVLTGHFTKSPNLASVLVVYYTPRGRTTVSCFCPPASFKSRQSEFMAVARAISFPR
jgi:hypothetical protein